MDRIKQYDALNNNDNITSEVQELAKIEGVCNNFDIFFRHFMIVTLTN